MKCTPIKITIIFIGIFLYSDCLFSQNYYSVELNNTVSRGNYTPFWLNANKHGLSSPDKNNGYLRAGLFMLSETEKEWKFQYALDVAAAYNFNSTFKIQQAFLDVDYKFWRISLGSKERKGEFKNSSLSSGALTVSENAQPIPQVRLEIPEYMAVKGTHGWFHLRGHLSYGRFMDDYWKEDFSRNGNSYTKGVLYHSKALFWKVGNDNSFPLVYEGGLEMAAQFGGDIYKNGKLERRMPKRAKDYLAVLIPQSGDDQTPVWDQDNITGNHVGSWHGAIQWNHKNIGIRGYMEHFFDDHSQMFFEYGAWKDGIWGIELSFFTCNWLKSMVYEFMNSTDQTGPIYHDSTEEIPDQVSGADDYYNHGAFNGWQHRGYGIGTPLVLSPIYNEDGNIIFKTTRVKAHHLGFSGEPFSDWKYRCLLTHTRNWGTYKNPYHKIKTNFSALLELTFNPKKLKGYHFTGAVAVDRGNLINNNVGGMISIRKIGYLNMKTK